MESITQTLQRHAREYVKQATSSGVWKRVATGRYERRTGEVVERSGGKWLGSDKCWQSAYAAMSFVDHRRALDRLATQAELTDDYAECEHSTLRSAVKMARHTLDS
jgi:hypothetical protein